MIKFAYSNVQREDVWIFLYSTNTDTISEIQNYVESVKDAYYVEQNDIGKLENEDFMLSIHSPRRGALSNLNWLILKKLCSMGWEPFNINTMNDSDKINYHFRRTIE